MRNLLRYVSIIMTTSLTSVLANPQPIAQSGEYQIRLVTEADGQSALVQLTQAGKTIAASEDVFALIAQAPAAIQQPLCQQIIDREIATAGGSEQTQKKMEATAKQFGADVFSYLPKLAVECYAARGVKVPGK